MSSSIIYNLSMTNSPQINLSLSNQLPTIQLNENNWFSIQVADKYDIGVAKVEGLSTKYGIDVVPTFVYFEDGIPSVYDEEGDELDSDPEAIAEWIEEQRTSSTIEEVNQYTYVLIESGRCMFSSLVC